MIVEEDDYIAHYGILRRSGRYPWGSGNNSSTQSGRNKKFLDFVEEMKKKGLSETEIAKGQGISVAQLRAAKTYAKNQVKAEQINMAERLRAKGMSNPAIAKRMGLPGESSVRALLAPGAKEKNDLLVNVANELKKHVDEKKYIDIGTGVETHMNISDTKLAAATFILLEQGYQVHTVPVPAIGTGYNTRHKVLVPPGVTQKEVWENRFNLKQISTFTDDGGRHFAKQHDPVSIDPKRVSVRYAEDGGSNADGVIYVRPGVNDLSLGKNNYAQVRIKVGDGHYLKGMAMYKDDLPEGTDLLFNTNKSKAEYPNKLDAMKKLAADKDLPFESVVRPIVLDVNSPNERVESAMNLVNEEGDWLKWTDTLSSQFLSKQTPPVVKRQLDVTYDRAQREFDEIMKLTNPAVKKKLLEDFADSADSAAVHLKAASMPRQTWKVILPIESLKPTEVYAPTYNNGENVVLVRFPHAGTFEIPELTVNNRHPEAVRLLKDTTDAIGIHPSVASHLSGADFDGDTVLVIPNPAGKIKITPALAGLKDFDPIATYPAYDGMKTMDGGRWNAKTKTVEFEEGKRAFSTKQLEMGKISNLITDMTIRGATHEELARAVRHSMVVIDAEKHHLNYKLSAQVNGIPALSNEYQSGHRDSNRPGASTLLSRKKSEVKIPELKGQPNFPQGAPVDRATGKKLQIPTGRTQRYKDGSVHLVKKDYKKLDLTDDAHTLSSGTKMEELYANYSNRQKALANKARVEAFKTPPSKWVDSSKKAYAKEVASLDSKLALAKKNRVLERHAQVIANAAIKARVDANPGLDGDSLKKIKYQELDRARTRVKLDQTKIRIEPNEWDAIQAGAISNSKLTQILAKADMDQVREYATPSTKLLMNTAKTQEARNKLALGYTRAEVASQLGVSISTLDRSLSGGG